MPSFAERYNPATHTSARNSDPDGVTDDVHHPVPSQSYWANAEDFGPDARIWDRHLEMIKRGYQQRVVPRTTPVPNSMLVPNMNCLFVNGYTLSPGATKVYCDPDSPAVSASAAVSSSKPSSSGRTL